MSVPLGVDVNQGSYHLLDPPVLGSNGAFQHDFKMHPEMLRDFFAGMALDHFVSTYYAPGVEDRSLWIANEAYKMADAMMKARGK